MPIGMIWEGNLIEAEDALGNRVFMKTMKRKSDKGNQISWGKRSYAYTPLGDESITDEAGRTTCYQYQKGGLLEKSDTQMGQRKPYTYDANGNLENPYPCHRSLKYWRDMTAWIVS